MAFLDLKYPFCPQLFSPSSSLDLWPFLGCKHPINDDEDPLEYISLSQNGQNLPVLPLFNFKSINILQSYNELLPCCFEQEHYIFDPTSGISELLPSCADRMMTQNGLELKCSQTSSPSYSLAFDPTKSPHYKIICIRRLSGNDEYMIAIYSSESRSWRPSYARAFSSPRDIDFTNGTFCNGAIHWTKRTRRGLYFDVKKEVLNEMPEFPRREQYTL